MVLSRICLVIIILVLIIVYLYYEKFREQFDDSKRVHFKNNRPLNWNSLPFTEKLKIYGKSLGKNEFPINGHV